MNITNLTPQQLRKAADIKDKILTLQTELIATLGAPVQTTSEALGEAPKKPRKRQISAAGRAAIAAAARTRWAKLRAAKGLTTPAVKPAHKPKRKMNAAWRAALAAARKARWAKAKEAAKGEAKPTKTAKKRFSAAARAALAAAARARWAEAKKAGKTTL